MRARIAQATSSIKSSFSYYVSDMFSVGKIFSRLSNRIYAYATTPDPSAEARAVDPSVSPSDAIIQKKLAEAKKMLEEGTNAALEETKKEAKEVIKDAAEIAQKAISTGNTVGSLAKQVIENKEVRQTTDDFFKQVIEGTAPTAMAALPKAAIYYPESREVIWSTMWRGAAFYAGPVITYYAGIRPLLKHALEGSYAVYPLYAIELATVTGLAIRAGNNLSIDMLINGLSIAKTTTPKVEEFKHDHEALVPCKEECGALVNQQASLTAQLNSMAAIRAVRVLDFAASTLLLTTDQPVVPILGAIVSYPFLRLIEGRMYVNYKLAAIGMCSKHREEILSANNGYCLGLGISYHVTLKMLNYLAAYGMSYLVEHMTGLSVPVVTTLMMNDFFVNDALAYLVSLSFAVAVTQKNNVLPGKKKGWEIFYWPNKAVEYGMSWVIDKITLGFKPKETDIKPDAPVSTVEAPKIEVSKDKENKDLDFTLAKPIVDAWNSDPVQLVLTFVNSDLLDLDRFLQRRSFDHFARIYGPTIHENLDWFKQLRKGKYPRFILEMMPESFVSSSSREILLTLRKKRYDALIDYIDKIINRICPTAFSHLPHVASTSALSELEERTKREKVIDPEAANTMQLVLAAKDTKATSEEIPAPVSPSSESEDDKASEKPREISAISSRLLSGARRRKMQAKQEKEEEENSRVSPAVSAMLGGKKDD